MHESSLQYLDNSSIQEFLFRQDNLQQLEAIVERDQSRLRQLQALPDAKRFGPRVNETAAQNLFATARDDVDRILGVSGLRAPKLRGTRLLSSENSEALASLGGGVACFLGSGVLLGSQVIRRWRAWTGSADAVRISRRRLLAGLALLLPGGLFFGWGVLAEMCRLNDAGYVWNEEQIEFPLGRRRVLTALLLVHEYVHHVQKKLNFFSRANLALDVAMEGHARGVERIWAKHRNMEMQTPAYEYHQLSFRSHELPRVYVALCDHLGEIPKEELLEDRTAASMRTRKPDPRYYGCALFRIWELTFGEEIYRTMVHGILPVSKHLPEAEV